MTKFENS